MSVQSSSSQQQEIRNVTSLMWGTIRSVREFALNKDFEIWFEQFEEYINANITGKVGIIISHIILIQNL